MDYSLSAPPSMGFFRLECWSGLPFPSPGELPNPGIEPGSPTLQADALPSEPPGKHKDVSKNSVIEINISIIYIYKAESFCYTPETNTVNKLYVKTNKKKKQDYGGWQVPNLQCGPAT